MGHQSSLNNSPGSTRIEFEAARTAAGVGGGRVVVWFRCCVFVVVGPQTPGRGAEKIPACRNWLPSLPTWARRLKR